MNKKLSEGLKNVLTGADVSALTWYMLLIFHLQII